MELHKILIGMSLSIVMVFGFLFWIADAVDKYNPSSIPSDYNESFYAINTAFDDLSQISNETQDQTNIAGEGSGNALSDFLGFFFGQGYKAIKTFITGINLLDDFADTAIDNTLGGTVMGSILKNQILVIIVIIIVSLLLHFIIKSERI